MSADSPIAPDRIALVTGGATGLGQAIARGLHAAGWRVVIASRDPDRFVGAPTAASAAPTGDVGNPTAGIDRWRLDLTERRSVAALIARARAELPPLAIVVCNAGVWPRVRTVTPAGHELGLAVNHIGHAALVLGLAPHLAPGARVITIASGLHARGRFDWGDLTLARGFDPLAAYARAKLANVLFALALARRLPALRSNAIHPGVIRTALHGDRPPPGAITPAAAARGPLALALAPEHAATTGRYFDQLAPRRPAPVALDRATQDRLWALTEGWIR